MKYIEAMTVAILSAQAIEGEISSLRSLTAVENGRSGMEWQGPLHVYKATSDPDTMYLHQAMKEKDCEHFLEAMDKEVEDQMRNKNFVIVPRSEVPAGKLVLPAGWQMKRKRDIRTREVKKWKARLNIDGSRMKEGEHYDQTYAPVASWNSIRQLLILSIINKWHTTQLDYVQTFPQAPVERELYMQIPKGY